MKFHFKDNYHRMISQLRHPLKDKPKNLIDTNYCQFLIESVAERCLVCVELSILKQGGFCFEFLENSEKLKQSFTEKQKKNQQ